MAKLYSTVYGKSSEMLKASKAVEWRLTVCLSSSCFSEWCYLFLSWFALLSSFTPSFPLSQQGSGQHTQALHSKQQRLPNACKWIQTSVFLFHLWEVHQELLSELTQTVWGGNSSNKQKKQNGCWHYGYSLQMNTFEGFNKNIQMYKHKHLSKTKAEQQNCCLRSQKAVLYEISWSFILQYRRHSGLTGLWLDLLWTFLFKVTHYILHHTGN